MNTLKFLCSIAILSSILPHFLQAQETYTVRLSQTNARAGMNDVAGAWEQHTSHKTNSDAFIATSSQIGGRHPRTYQ